MDAPSKARTGAKARPDKIAELLPEARREALTRKVDEDSLRFCNCWTDPMAMW